MSLRISAPKAAGTAAAADVLAGKTFSSNTLIKAAGAMVDNGAVLITPGAAVQPIPEGYHDGLGTVAAAGSSDPNLVTGNIRGGVSIYGVAGKTSVVETADATAVAGDILTTKTAYVNGVKRTGTMASNGSQTATLETQGATKVVPAGYTPGGTVTATITNLTAANIVKAVVVGGVTGEAIELAAVAGDYELVKSAAIATMNMTTYTKTKEIQIVKAGVYRVKFDIQWVSYGCYGTIYVNGVARGVEHNQSSAGTVTFSDDITVNAGDLVQLYIRSMNVASTSTNNFLSINVSAPAGSNFGTVTL